LPNVGPYIYTTLAFLALLGAPYIYEISSLRVNVLVMCHVGRAVKPMLPLYFLALFGLHFSHEKGICFTPIFNVLVELIATES